MLPREEDWIDKTVESLYRYSSPTSGPRPPTWQQADHLSPQAFRYEKLNVGYSTYPSGPYYQSGPIVPQPRKQDYFAYKVSPPPPYQPVQPSSYELKQSKHYFDIPYGQNYNYSMQPSAPVQQPTSGRHSYFAWNANPYVPAPHNRPNSIHEQQPQVSQFSPQTFSENHTRQSWGSQSGILDQFAYPTEHPPTKEILKKKPIMSQKDLLPQRRVRPKVIEAKGAIQCAGTNLKKGTQCKNAALMEFFGPRPIYCAEHIELDPDSIYCKCASPYGKVPGDGKGCKEIVLKEFQRCYKHFGDRLNALPMDIAPPTAQKDLKRVTEILAQLETEAASAKRKRHDLFQRKNKLIPKFAKMLSQLETFIARLDSPTKKQETSANASNIDQPVNPKSTPDVDNLPTPPTGKLPFSSSLLDDEWKDLFVEEDATRS